MLISLLVVTWVSDYLDLFSRGEFLQNKWNLTNKLKKNKQIPHKVPLESSLKIIFESSGIPSFTSGLPRILTEYH